MMLSIASFDPIDPDEYRWRSSRDSPKVWRRCPLANESMWLARPKDSRDLFVYASLAFKSPIILSALCSAAKSAWQHLRYDVPELVLTTGTSPKDGKAYVQYQPPRTQEEVDQWVERTSTFTIGEQRQDFEDLRGRILQKRRGHHTDNVFLFSHAQFAAENFIRVSRLQLMIYVDHLITDGIGARILLGRYLSLLTFIISTSFRFEPSWQENHNVLSPPWICLMNCNQELSGNTYTKRVSRNQDILTSQMVISPH
jgi:15-O-acetyltransferase Tri3